MSRVAEVDLGAVIGKVGEDDTDVHETREDASAETPASALPSESAGREAKRRKPNDED